MHVYWAVPVTFYYIVMFIGKWSYVSALFQDFEKASMKIHDTNLVWDETRENYKEIKTEIKHKLR